MTPTPWRPGRGRWRRGSGRARCGRGSNPRRRSRGGADGLRTTKSSSPRRSARPRGWAAHQGVVPGGVGRCLDGLELADLRGQCLGAREQLLLLLALGPRDLRRAASARPASPRTSRSPAGGRCRRTARGPRPRRTARAWPGRLARGRGRHGGCADLSRGQAIRAPAGRARDTAGWGRPAYFGPCSTDPAPSCSAGPPSASASSRCSPSRSTRAGAVTSSTTAGSRRSLVGRPGLAAPPLRWVGWGFQSIPIIVVTLVVSCCCSCAATGARGLQRRRGRRRLSPTRSSRV